MDIIGWNGPLGQVNGIIEHKLIKIGFHWLIHPVLNYQG
jgi:hypothetical protein